MHTLPIKYHPGRLGDGDIATLERVAFRNWDHAPVFFAWLVELLQAEQTRRLETTRGVFIEPQLPALPVGWRGQDLAQALTAANTLSFTLPDFKAGQFVDCVVQSLTALVSAKLEAPTRC